MAFTFSTTHVVFGPGVRSEISVHAAGMGRRCLLVTGSRPERCAWLQEELSAVMDDVLTVSMVTEPDTESVTELARAARARGCDVVVAVGGGSVLDAGKALAALATNSRDVLDYLEVVGRGMPLEKRPLPMIAVPTTAGTGSEATANAVLLCRAHGVKVSLRSTAMIPDLAVVDPGLAVSLPPRLTAATGMDALTQLMEAFVSHQANPLTDPLCSDGMARAARSLRRAVADGEDLEARSDMALASLFSGMALANARLGAVHGFAAPLGASLGAPHGDICAALLPHVMEMNIAALRAAAPGHPALDRYAEVGLLLTGERDAMAGVRFVESLCADLGIRNLESLGLGDADVPDAARKAAAASSMKGNPLELDHEQLVAVLRRAMGR
jgi:alcohol dehydrogenase class IV